MWYNAKVRDPIVGLPVGSKVLIRKADDVSHTSIGPTWWVFDGKNLRQFAESLGGHDLYRIVHRGREFSKQDAADKKARPFLARYWRHRNLPLEAPKTPKFQRPGKARVNP